MPVIPRDILYRYNAFDVSNTYDLIELYLMEIEAQQEKILTLASR